MSDLFSKAWAEHWFQHILDHPEKPWDKNALSKNPNLSVDLIEDLIKSSWFNIRDSRFRDSLALNPNLSWDFIQKYLNEPRTISYLSNHPSITWEIIQGNPDKSWRVPKEFPGDDSPVENLFWNWSRISSNPNITWEIIQANPDKEWDFMELSDNPNITLDMVQDRPDEDWYIPSLAQHKNTTLDLIEENLNGLFRDIRDFEDDIEDSIWVYFSRNPNLTWEFVKAHRNKSWDWSYLTEHPNITWEIITSNCYYEWRWSRLSRNPNITWEFIQANPEIPWNWSLVSENPNISWEIVNAHPEISWDYDKLSENPMPRARKEFETKLRKMYQLLIRSILNKFEVSTDLETLIFKFL